MKQISLITPQRMGLVTEITEALGKAKVNIETMDASVAEDYAIIILTVDHYDRAMGILQKFEDMDIVTEDAILVKLKDEPGALAKIARRFTDASIGMRSIRIIQRNPHFSLVAISTERSKAALALVEDVLIS